MAKHQKKYRKKEPAAKHRLNWLWGKQSVIETLQIARWRIYELFINPETAELFSELLLSKKNEGVEVHVVTNAHLQELSQSTEHQGIVARVSKYPYLSLDDLRALLKSELEPQTKRDGKPLWVVIDRIQDTFQFASILRCCQSAAVCGVILGEYCQAQVTTQIARASFGAVNHFPIFQCTDLAIAVQQLKELGVAVVAYHPESALNVGDLSLSKPTALIIGNDSQEIASPLLALSDHQINISMAGNGTPLPATVASGILLYEFCRQRS